MLKRAPLHPRHWPSWVLVGIIRLIGLLPFPPLYALGRGLGYLGYVLAGSRRRVALRNLSDQEQTVIVNRFGLEGGRVFTLKEIGGKLGVSRERVRQIESQAKMRLRKVIARQQRIDAPPRRNRNVRTADSNGDGMKQLIARVKPTGERSH